jgi:hypothetical protein
VGDENDVRSGIRDSKFQSSAPTGRDASPDGSGCEHKGGGI